MARDVNSTLFRLLPLLWCALVMTGRAADTMIDFDPPSLVNGQKRIDVWEEDGFRFGSPNGVTHCDSGLAHYPTNGSAFLQCLSDQRPLQITNLNGQTFTAKSVDISEYSTVFAGSPTVVTFVGTKADNTTVSVTFSTDGQNDGPGVLMDFQTFQFPASFTSLKKITVNDPIFSIDHFVFAEDGIAPPGNEAPLVNAGPDQSVTLADGATLAGAGTDSTFAGGQTSLALTWTKISGPGTATFANANQPDTTVAFSAKGSYTLRLTAFDGEFTSSDTVTIVVITPAVVGTSLDMTSEAGDWIGGGRTYHLTTATGTFSAERNYHNGVSIRYYTGSSWWDLDFAAPAHAPLKPGTYTATRFPFQGITSGGLDVSGEGRGSNRLNGTFVVKKVIYGAGTSIVAFWATFEQHSEGATPALRGEVQFNSGSNATPVNQAPGVYAGDSQRITFPTAAVLSGIAADDDLPSPSAFKTTWSQVSGPGTTTFADAGQPATSATFSAPGTYVLRLTATDGTATQTSDVTIVLIDPNEQTSLDLTFSTGPAEHYSLTDGTFTAARTYNNGVTVNFNGTSYSPYYSVSFRAPANAPLKPGVYADAIDINGDITRPGIQISGTGYYGSGAVSFEIKKVIYGPDGKILSFWATFAQATTPYRTVTRGEIKFDAGSTAVPVNQAPGVHAGIDQRLAFSGAAIPLNGLAGDDDLPSAASFTTEWTKVSGPGEVSFADAHAAATGATFTAPGQYVLRLTGFDSALKTTDEVTFTLVDPNEQTSLDVTTSTGQSFHYTSLDGPFTATIYENNQIYLTFNGAGSYSPWWYLNFNAPAHAPLKAGVYNNLTDAGYDITRAGFSMYGSISAYVTAGASFEVKKMICTADRQLVSFWATFDLPNPYGPNVRGEIKINAGATTAPANQAPGVYAGADQRIVYPAAVSLSGLAGDDDLPSPTALTTTWSQVSGPGTTTFAATNQLNSTASFSAPGDYVLRLTATDGELSSTDEVSVRVVDANVNTALVMRSEPGDYIGGGDNYSYSLVTGDFTAQGTFGDGISISYTGPNYDHWWYLHFAPPAGQKLHVGEYNNAARWPFQASSQAGLDVSGDGRGSNTLTGKFKILELTFKDDGSPASFHATFEQHSEGGRPALFGEITFNASQPGTFLNLPPTVSAGPDGQAVAQISQPLQGSATDDGLPVHQLTTTWSKVSGSGGVTFADEHSPTTAVTFSTAGVYVLRFEATDTDLTRSDEVTFLVSDPNAVTQLDMTSNPGEHIGLGLTYHYTAGTGQFAVSTDYRRGISVSYRANALSDHWTLDFSPPYGETLQVGTYLGATRWPGENYGDPGLNVSGNGRNSMHVTGQFTILELERNGDQILSFHAIFEQHSEGSGLALRGEILYNAASSPFHLLLPHGIVQSFSDTAQVTAQLVNSSGTANPTYEWSSSDPKVVFTKPHALDTEVKFPAEGFYTLTITGTEGAFSTTSTMQIRVRSRGGRWGGFVQGRVDPGFLTVTMNARGAMTGAIRFGVQTLRFRGSLNEAGELVIPLDRFGLPGTLHFSFTGDDQLVARIETDGYDYLSTLSDYRNRQGMDEDVPRKYAILFQSSIDDGVTTPVGWGKILLRRNGSFAVVANLPDGSHLTGAGAVASDSTATALLRAPGGRGWFALSSIFGEAPAWSGTAQWVRLSSRTRTANTAYLGVLGDPQVAMQPNREPFTQLNRNTPAALRVVLPNRLSVTDSLTIQPGGRVSGFGDGRSFADFRFRPDGSYSGYFIHPKTRQTVRFSGILYPPYAAGLGFAIHNGQPGRATLTPLLGN